MQNNSWQELNEIEYLISIKFISFQQSKTCISLQHNQYKIHESKLYDYW